ncbi:PREDICTED: T-cell surface antigen CD2 isoform X3 [Chinchilla lanigera]|uniref:T-cell surface antigen CD2 isoform X3 n=1 Tax=Chinchilla lanigera TaxID=34839 RepID=UPI000697462E|nr:PREDICTED: T-cell surface antigen CD2 isoform X3 [Chinchilla lanigera]
MSLPYKSLASFFLLFSFSTKGSTLGEPRVLWGALGRDVNLDIPNFQMSDVINEVRWEAEGRRVAQLKGKNQYRLNQTYEILPNGTLKIKHLERSLHNIYKVIIYNTSGTSVLDKEFHLRIQEMVSKPQISWDCSNKTLTCEVVNGTNPKLNLYQHGKYLMKGSGKIITYRWKKLTEAFSCTASNEVSEESDAVAVSCSGKRMNLFLIAGFCVGGGLLALSVALIICYTYKRKMRNGRRCEHTDHDTLSDFEPSCSKLPNGLAESPCSHRRGAGDKHPQNNHRGRGPKALPHPSPTSSKSVSLPPSPTT